MSGTRVPQGLTLIVDGRCGLCRRLVRWLATAPVHVPLRFVAAQDETLRKRFPGLSGEDPDEMVVLDDHGGLYGADKAYLMVLWALVDGRPWAHRLAAPALRPLVRGAVHALATHRQALSGWLGLGDAELSDRLCWVEPPRCSIPCADVSG